jgi:hypothetical protein
MQSGASERARMGARVMSTEQSLELSEAEAELLSLMLNNAGWIEVDLLSGRYVLCCRSEPKDWRIRSDVKSALVSTLVERGLIASSVIGDLVVTLAGRSAVTAFEVKLEQSRPDWRG